jgi:hypothetical protein
MWGGQGPYKDCRATGDDDNYHNNAFVFASFNEIISVEMYLFSAVSDVSARPSTVFYQRKILMNSFLTGL